MALGNLVVYPPSRIIHGNMYWAKSLGSVPFDVWLPNNGGPMLYILRLTNGDCVVAMAADERSARETAKRLSQDATTDVATARRLDSFAVQFSPTEDGNLEVAHWDDATLDNILASEYPSLNEAYLRANAEPFLKASDFEEPILSHLRTEHERNTEIIRAGLRLELDRFRQEPSSVATDGNRSRRRSAHAKSAS
jgi:hypothetical protein